MLGSNWRVYATHNAHTALSLIDQHKADWLLLNPALAKNSGLELLYEINSWMDLRQVKTILLTYDADYFQRYKQVLKELNVLHILPIASLDSKLLSTLLKA